MGDLGDFGMTISRLPKRRESTEKAPGPSNARDIAITTIRPAVIPERLASGNANEAKATVKQDAAAMLLATGVRNPKRRHTPLPKATKLVASAGVATPPSFAKSDIASMINTSPTAARRISNPAPGPPLGNVENSLCSVHSLRRPLPIQAYVIEPCPQVKSPSPVVLG